MEVNSDIVHNFLLDLRKREVGKIERAQIVRAYLDERKISQRQLAREIGVAHGTVQDWLLFEKVTETDLKNMKDDGYTETDAYRLLRANGAFHKESIRDVTPVCVDVILSTAIFRLGRVLRSKKIKVNGNTKALIHDLKVLVERLDERCTA